MTKTDLQVLAEQAAKSIMTEKDLLEFSAMLKKITKENVFGRILCCRYS